MPKIVLVTGASSGFGRETVKMFAKDGYKIIAIGRRQERLKELKKELSECDIYTISLDIRDKKEVFDAIENLPLEYKNIDILVNNAGLALGLEKAQNALIEDWEVMIDTNIKGLLYITKAVLPRMIKRKSGYIFNLGSIAGNWPFKGANVYGSTKAFVQQFSLNLRNDLKDTNIRVTNIEPGFAKTEFSKIRFKNDDKKADSVYDGFQPLVGKDIANIIFMLSKLPLHVNVNTLEVMPTAQTWAGFALEQNC
ncbi:MAG: SDR family NAD(P)-dependent oxidoreductase [Sulfurospirillum sp.]|nr:SDR family NAD(P)-dependent oxidoreductase [Sulfurospirillum sp.]MBL0702493.1 SDR family NAD(P)-dependent oxidoreductase [Sulfurospirillum sp.]